MTSILVISEKFYPEGGGAELATYLILTLLTRYNFKITVVTGTQKPVAVPGIEYYITPYLRYSNRLTKSVYLSLLTNNRNFIGILREHDILYIPLYSYPIIRIAKEKGLKTVIHLHNYMPIRYSSVKYFFESNDVDILSEFRLAIFQEYHAHKSLMRTLLSPLSLSVYYLIDRKSVEEADKIICVSRRQAEIVARSDPHLAGKTEVIYNPLPPELVSVEPRKELNSTPTFLYAGGDSYIKGFQILLRAMKHLGKQGVNARFILTNRYSSENISALRQLVEKYRSLKIKIAGRVEYSKLLEFHRKAWALVFPSIWEEPLPYAVIEAAVLGTVPIAAKIGGVVELLSNTVASRYMFTAGNYIELAEKLIDISLLSPNEICSLGLELRRDTLVKLDQNKVEKRIVKIFNELSAR